MELCFLPRIFSLKPRAAAVQPHVGGGSAGRKGINK